MLAFFLVSSLSSDFTDKLLAKVALAAIKGLAGSKINPLLEPIDEFADKFEMGQSLYEIISKIDANIDISSLQENVSNYYQSFLENTTYDFFTFVGTSTETLDKIAQISKYLKRNSKISEIVNEFMNNDDIPIDSLLNIVPTFIDVFDGLFVFLNVDKIEGRKVLTNICMNYEKLTVFDVAEMCGIKFSSISHFFEILHITFTQETSVPFLQFFVDLGFNRPDVLNETINLLTPMMNGEPLYVDVMINQLKGIIPPFAEAIIEMIQCTIGKPVNDIIYPLSVLIDFRVNTLENRLSILTSTIESIITNSLIQNLIPLSVIQSMENFVYRLNEVQRFGIPIPFYEEEQLILLQNISNIINQAISKDSALISTLISTMTPSESNIRYIFKLTESLTNPNATMHDLIVSICGLIGGQKTINSFENIVNTILDYNVSLLVENNTNTFDTLSSYLSMFFGQDSIKLHPVLIDLISDLAKSGGVDIESILNSLSQGNVPHFLLINLNDLFNVGSSFFGVLDNFIGSNFVSKISKVHKIIYPLHKILNNIGLYPYLPPVIPHLLKSYTDLTDGSHTVSFAEIIAPLTIHHDIASNYLDKVFEAFTSKGATAGGLFKSLDKKIIDLRTTIHNIIDWPNRDILSVKNIIDSFVIEEPSTAKLLSDLISFEDIVPLQFYFHEFENITEEEKQGNLPLSKAFLTILDYNATELFEIGEIAHKAISSPEYSLSKVIDYITLSNVSGFLEPSKKIYDEIVFQQKLSYSTLNMFGSTIAKDVGNVSEPPKPQTPTPNIIPEKPSNSQDDNNAIENNSNPNEVKKSDAGLIVGIAIGAISVFIIVAVLVETAKKGCRNKCDNDDEREPSDVTEGVELV